MLLIFIKMERLLDLVSQTLTRSLRVSSMLLLVDVACAATLDSY